MQDEDWGVCCGGCQCPRYERHLRAFQPFLPGVLPPPHLRDKEVTVQNQENRFVKDPNSKDLSVFKKWMPIDSTFVIPRGEPLWNP